MKITVFKNFEEEIRCQSKSKYFMCLNNGEVCDILFEEGFQIGVDSSTPRLIYWHSRQRRCIDVDEDQISYLGITNPHDNSPKVVIRKKENKNEKD